MGSDSRKIDPSVILFDGMCALCDASVEFVLKRDPAGRFRFAALQSDAGRRRLAERNIESPELGSVVLLESTGVYTASTAALRIALRLRFPWPILYALVVIPRPLRDVVYRWIARNRYRWFGRREACRMPTPEQADRFLM